MSTQQVTLRDVKSIHNFTFSLPPDGGVVVLHGRNGLGKTNALEAVDALVSGRGKLEVRDGAKRGEVEGFGARITVAKSTRRSGEAEVWSFDGRFDVSDLIDPPIKDPVAADSHRIKAIVQLSGADITQEHFAELFAGDIEELRKYVSAEDLGVADPVARAAKIKRALEAAARNAESQADHAKHEAAALVAQAEGVDLNASDDDAQLQAVLEEALSRRATLKQQAEHARRTQEQAHAARAEIERAEAENDGCGVDAAMAAEGAAAKAEQEAASKVAALRDQLNKAEAEHEQRRADHAHAITVRQAEERHAASLAAWREQVAKAEGVEVVSQDSLDAAEQAVADARNAIEQGVVVRRAKQALAKAQAARDEQAAHERQAHLLREAARGTDDVLSDVIAESCDTLRVESGRLVLDTKRGTTYYSELSQGERGRIALDIVCDAMPETGLLTLSQEVWEGLDPIHRREIVEHAKRRRVVVLTAEASADEELTAVTE